MKGGETQNIQPLADSKTPGSHSRAIAGINKLSSPTPWCSKMISVKAAAGQPPPGKSASSSLKPVA
jgi:hypothetical protein